MKMAAPYSFVDRHFGRNFDETVKNKFKWEWLSEQNCHNDFFSTYVRKLDSEGVAWCCFSKTVLYYGKNGKACFKSHAKSKVHIRERLMSKSNHKLPAALQATKNKVDGCSSASTEPKLPYRSTPNCVGLGLPTVNGNSDAPDIPKPVGIKDCMSHAEALICSFIAEHSLPLSLAPHLIHLSQALAKDPKALNLLHMERQTATYKLKYGVSYLEHLRLIKRMKTSPFSINLDECTSKSSKKRILNVLVCLYSSELSKSTCHLYSSCEMTVVNAETVFRTVMDQLRTDEIPLTNVISVLSDSAAYMRGSVNGFQTKLREVAPHLIDIDGDVCHHINNSVKKFYSELDPDHLLSKALDSLFNDIDFSADLRGDLFEMCKLLNLPQKAPIQRACHRWMSIYDSSVRFVELHDALILFYSSWLTVQEKKDNQPLLTSILSTLKKESRLASLDVEPCAAAAENMDSNAPMLALDVMFKRERQSQHME